MSALQCVGSLLKRLRVVCIYQPGITEYVLDDALAFRFVNAKLIAHTLRCSPLDGGRIEGV